MAAFAYNTPISAVCALNDQRLLKQSFIRTVSNLDFGSLFLYKIYMDRLDIYYTVSTLKAGF